ncbi:MAG: DUF21 domain-containing protein, partial [Kiritimatiellae bacterium]|nr:DUF21 domain-containing protein [Kiritimatiellia bacterium]
MVVLEVILLLALFALSFFFSGSETILFSLTSAQRQRIAARDKSAGDAVEACLGDSALLLSTLLVGNTLVNFAIATIGYRLFAEWIPAGGVLAVPVMTVGLLVFGEITPKQIALRRAESLAPASARLLLFWRKVLAPLNFFLKSASRAFRRSLERERRALSDAELLSVLEASAERG